MWKPIVLACLILSLVAILRSGVGPLTVTRVIDGKTLRLSNGETVRLIGVDIPEPSSTTHLEGDVKRAEQDVEAIRELGKSAKEFISSLALGKPVRLDYDVQRRDKDQCLLAYVYVVSTFPKETPVIVQESDDFHYYVKGDKSLELFLNATLLIYGQAQAKNIPPNVKHQDLFLTLQKEAKELKKGLWE
jgi:micrococcal nuclease